MENSEKIKVLLNLLVIDDHKDFDAQFCTIAETLFRNFHIQKGDIKYYFLEIEFYYYSKRHPDIITYPRNSKNGEWFFHASGVDLTFMSDTTYVPNSKPANDKDYFGGILIRSLLKEEEGKKDLFLYGPLKCEWDLFDQFNAFNITDKDFPHIVFNEDTTNGIKMTNSKRKIRLTNFEKRYMDLKKIYNIDDKDNEKFRNDFNAYIGKDNNRVYKYRYNIETINEGISKT